LCAQVGAVEGEAARALGVAYTPMHGVGCKWVEEALRRLGFAPPHVVAEQREPDGHFPTVRFPNPEEPGAMDLLLALARASGADVALANDPDADRLAVAAPDAQGVWRALTGNQIGALLGDHALAQAEGSAEPLCVGTTIVSSQLLGHIARAHGAVCYETLTGFKWIANEAMRREEAEGARFVFGYEEALGYTVGRLVRDKDGVSAAAAFARLAAELKAQGQTVYGRLEALYRAHGLFVTGQVTIPWRPGSPGPHERLRAHPPTHIAGRAVVSRDDLSVRARFDAQGARSEVALPASDVLIYRLDDGARVIVRPSGTEPKLKCYYELQARVAPDEPFVQAEARAQAALQALMADHQREMFA
jgi:phosphomannomutase